MEKTNTITITARHSDLLQRIGYDPNGGRNTPNNTLADEYYYSIRTPITVERDGKTVIIGDDPFAQLVKSVCRKWVLFRDYLPSCITTATDEHHAVVAVALLQALHDGDDPTTITKTLYKSLDNNYKRYQVKDYKTVDKTENLNLSDRTLIATLFTGDLATVGTTADDLDSDDRPDLDRLMKLFSKVKENHPYIPYGSWLCAQSVALSMPTAVAVARIYGDDLSPKKLRSAYQKYYKNSKTVFNALLESANGKDYLKWSRIRDLLETETVTETEN